MKNICLILFSLLIVSSTMAQDKKTIKEWEKKKKAMDPIQFKKIVEEHNQTTTEKTNLTQQVSNLEDKLKVKEELNAYLTKELDSLKKVVAESPSGATNHDLSAANKKTSENVSSSKSNSNEDAKWGKGIVFKVQIGAFKNKNLSKYLDNNKNFSGDIDADGQRKYTLGYFRDYWEADNFKKLLREMGVSDAWVVAYKDGKRVSIKDVLEGALE